MKSSTQCNTDGKCCCSGSKEIMFLLSLVFAVSAALVLGVLLAFPSALLTIIFIPGIFDSYAQAFMFLTPTFALAFLGITFLTRLAHISLEGPAYFKRTYFYEYLVS